MCAMAGCDYTRGVYGLGVSKALPLLRTLLRPDLAIDDDEVEGAEAGGGVDGAEDVAELAAAEVEEASDSGIDWDGVVAFARARLGDGDCEDSDTDMEEGEGSDLVSKLLAAGAAGCLTCSL